MIDMLDALSCLFYSRKGENMQKRILSLAISILLVIALIPMGAVTVLAQDEFSIDRIQEDFVMNMALQKESTAQSNKHSIVLEDRKNMTLTGIKEVSNFNEQKIELLTEMDQLTITGRSLHIINFSPNTGDLRLRGTIDSLVYADKNKNRGPVWERFKELITRLIPVNQVFRYPNRN